MNLPDSVIRFFRVVMIIVVIALILGILHLSGPKQSADKNEGFEALVSIVQVSPTDKSPRLPLFGYVESPQTAELTSAVSGDVIEVLVSEGDSVQEGQPLVRIDSVDLQLLLKEREAELEDIKARISMELRQYESDKIALGHEKRLLELTQENRKRAEKLFKKRLGSEKALDDARTALERQSLSYNSRRLIVENHPARLSQLKAQKQRSESALQRTKRDLERAVIIAPFAGQVASVKVSKGDRVGPGSMMIVLYDHSRLEVRAQIPVRYLESVRTLLGEDEVVEAETVLDGKRVRLHLDRLSGEARKGTAGLPGLFIVTEGSSELALGRFINFSLSLPAVKGVVELPYEAIYGANRVYLFKEGVMKPVLVERIGETRLENGLSAVLVKSDEIVSGDKVITTQVPNAMDGRKVKLAQIPAGE